MKISLKKNFLQAVILVSGMFLNCQPVKAQTSLRDSLRHMLNNFQEQAKDEKIRQAIQEVQALYTTEAISDSLAKKLLLLDGLLIANRSKHDQQMVISYAENIVELFQNKHPHKEHPDYAASISHLGNLYYYIGRYEKALPLLQQALAIFKKVLGEEHSNYATSLHNLADLYNRTGKYENAIGLHLQALAVRKKTLGEEHPDYAYSLNKAAQVYDNMGQYEKAIVLFQQAARIRKKVLGEEHPRYASSLNNLALTYWRMGQFDKALPLYQLVLSIDKKNLREDHRDYATSLNNLALLYQTMGWPEKALPLYQQSLAITKKTPGEEHPFYPQSLNNVATIYASMEQHDKALLLYQESLLITKKILGEGHTEYADILNNIATVYSSMGQHEKSLSLSQQALEITKKSLGEDHPHYATILRNVAYSFQIMGQYKEAFRLYQQALIVYKKFLGEYHPDYARSLNSLGLLNLKSGSQKEAAPLLIEATFIILRHLSQTYATLSELEKMIFLSNQSSQFNYLRSLLFIEPHNSPVLRQLYQTELTLKGMVLEDQKKVLNAIRKSGDSTALQLYEQWYFIKDLIGKQLLLPIARRLPYLDSLQEETTQLEQQLSRQAASFRSLQQSQQITTSDISRKLSKDAAAIEFIQFRFYNKKWTDSILYAALILLPGDSVARYVPLFEEKQLQRLLKPSLTATNTFGQFATLQKLYAGTGKSAPGGLSSSLYQLIWRPLEKHLVGVNTVYFAPAGLLHRVALGALRPDATHLLIDNFQLKQVLSTRSVALPAAVTQKPLSAAIWGNIDYNVLPSVATNTYEAHTTLPTVDSTPSSFNFYTSDTRGSRGKLWNPLPGTKMEIESLQKLFSPTGISLNIDSGKVATEEAFKGLSGNSPQIIHLATHGFFLPVNENKPKAGDDMNTGGRSFTVQQNPMFRSGLVLAGGNDAWKGGTAREGKEDGILTAYEIARLDLSGTDLLVLSACETALGDLQGTEGVIGLQRAFKMAGVKQMVMSLWRVPDKETTELMTLFYTYWLNGQSTGEALRKAQLKMKEKYPPYYWAAFVLVE